jgi:AraC-like DNA-binding protein
MSADALSDLLRAVRLHGAVFYHVEGVAPWVAETPQAREIIPAIMPGAEHMFAFHGLVRGSCWAGIAGETPVRMEGGDVILFPKGDPHVMSSRPGLRGGSLDVGEFFSPRPPQMPFSLRVTESRMEERPHGGAPDCEILVCGYLGLDVRPFNPLIASLPRVLLISGSTLGANSWVTTFLQTAVIESNSKRPGGEAVLERMTEMLFVEVLRRHIDSLPPEQTGWLAGMRDATVGRALSLMHEKPSEAWTLERLSEGVGLSRSSLHERFVQLIGQPPMQYLTQWRMQVASGRLRDTNAKLTQVAAEVGYESDAAFSRAFKRVAGQSPGAWRKAKRANA